MLNQCALVSRCQISQARQKTEKAKDLEGIDMSNIVQGSRKRGTPAVTALSSKKQRRVKPAAGSNAERSATDESELSEESDSSHDQSISANGDEESEVEFDFSG